MGIERKNANNPRCSPWDEDSLLPLSALQHLVFCERQCALIHIERIWRDNSPTLEGSHQHKWVHEELPRREVRGDVVILRGLALRSTELGIIGRSDVVEMHRKGSAGVETSPGGLPEAIQMEDMNGFWTPFPVEYKHGKPKPDHCDDVQLCAQALCIEEMMRVRVPEGALFYGKVRRRHDVLIGDELRKLTREIAERLHKLIEKGITPKAEKAPKCKSCSLLQVCMPKATGGSRSSKAYLLRRVDEALRGGEG